MFLPSFSGHGNTHVLGFEDSGELKKEEEGNKKRGKRLRAGNPGHHPFTQMLKVFKHSVLGLVGVRRLVESDLLFASALASSHRISSELVLLDLFHCSARQRRVLTRR